MGALSAMFALLWLCLVSFKVESLDWNWYDVTEKLYVYDMLMWWKKLEVWIESLGWLCLVVSKVWILVKIRDDVTEKLCVWQVDMMEKNWSLDPNF